MTIEVIVLLVIGSLSVFLAGWGVGRNSGKLNVYNENIKSLQEDIAELKDEIESESTLSLEDKTQKNTYESILLLLEAYENVEDKEYFKYLIGVIDEKGLDRTKLESYEMPDLQSLVLIFKEMLKAKRGPNRLNNFEKNISELIEKRTVKFSKKSQKELADELQNLSLTLPDSEYKSMIEIFQKQLV